LIAAVVAYGVANALLYCSLLPLWEGFDEAFHYAYVQSLAVHRTLPILGRDALSEEVWNSMQLAPVSHIVRRSYPGLTTFSEFFDLPPAEREDRRQQLNAISPALAAEDFGTPKNYEAHQPPLAYVLLAIPDALWAGAVLPARVWRLRVFGAILSCLAMATAALHLSRGLGLSRLDELVLLFLLFSTQMFYATVCHVANDWLAVPLAVGLFGAAVHFHLNPASKNALILALVLAAGLLTKAYFLVFVPAVLALAAWHLFAKPRLTFRSALAFLLVPALSGPWYWRNISLYGSLSGTVESVNGVDIRAVAAALPHVPWFETIGYMARGSLWTGNNTFSTFSRITLDLMLALICAGVIARLVATRKEGLNSTERIVLAGIFCFILELVYATAQEYVFRQGMSAGASVWHTQPLLVPVMCLVLAGFARAGPYGRWLRVALLLVWTYVIIATYWLKLIPLYAAEGGEKSVFLRLLQWYVNGVSTGLGMLSSVAMLPTAIICFLAMVVTIGAIVLCRFLCLSAMKDDL
jgi:hypothetical protein